MTPTLDSGGGAGGAGGLGHSIRVSWTWWLLTSTVALLLLLEHRAPMVSARAVHWDENVREQIDTFINVTMECRTILGLNLAIVTKDRVLYSRGYGCLDLETCAPANSKSLFSLASVTKAFATTLLGIFLKENKLTFDTPVRDVLGEDFFFYDGIRTSQVTMRDLCAHRTGVPNNNNIRMQDNMSRELLARKMRFLEPTGQFRSSFIYNNLMYGLISHITEKLANDTWENMLRTRIFMPLGMTDTSFSHEVAYNMSNLATSYLPYNYTCRPVSGRLHSLWGALGGSGSILTTSDDIAQWLQVQLNDGRDQDGNVIIPKDVLDETRTPFVTIPDSASDANWRQPTLPITYSHHKYGLGWRIGLYRGSRQILHTGSSWGYGALLTLRPDDELAIHIGIVGLDDGYIGRRLIHIYIMDLLLSYDPWINTTTACTFPEPWGPAPRTRKYPGYFSKIVRDRNVPPSLPLSEYEGTYGNFGYGNISVVANSTEGTLDMTYGELGRWHLHCKRANDFAGEGYGDVWPRELRSVHFRNSKGASDSVDEVVVSFEVRLPPVFKRNLMMSEAPPPPDPNDCGSPTKPPLAGSARPQHVYNEWTVVVLAAILCVTRRCQIH